MKLQAVKAQVFVLYAGVHPLLMIGQDERGFLTLVPTPYIERHRVAFARWCKRHVGEYRGCTALVQHRLSPKTHRWATWLGVRVKIDARQQMVTI